MKQFLSVSLVAVLLFSCAFRKTEKLTIIIQDGETWYVGVAAQGHEMPLNDSFEFDFRSSRSNNQMQPVLVSTKGRYVYSESPFRLSIKKGVLRISGSQSPMVFSDRVCSLKEGYLSVAKRFYHFSGRYPDETLFAAPQINTWIELGKNHNQRDVLAYAKTMKDNGIQPGVIMIDDTWQSNYGVWDFNHAAFPNPEEMMNDLHEMGYKVMLWICPFVNSDTKFYDELRGDGAFVRDFGGLHTKKVKWWNGSSAVLDLSNPAAIKWFDEQLLFLQTNYGVDGFKFDAGDPEFYDKGKFHRDVSPLEQCRLFNAYGLKYPLNEFRTTWLMGGEPLAQRLCDKAHEWGDLQKLIPHMLLNGLMGHAFTCPDMIGGGDIKYFNLQDVDEELVVRSAQVHALMPMMQFSANPFRILSEENSRRIVETLRLRQTHVPYIMSLVKHAAVSGEPVIRMMEYEFPDEGLAGCKEQFMLGDKLLVAPVVRKGATTKKVCLPSGKWKDSDGKIWSGGQSIEIKVDLSDLPLFERL